MFATGYVERAEELVNPYAKAVEIFAKLKLQAFETFGGNIYQRFYVKAPDALVHTVLHSMRASLPIDCHVD